MSSLTEVNYLVDRAMDKLKKLFKPGVKITVLVRSPGFPERDFMLTDDHPDAIIAAVIRRANAER